MILLAPLLFLPVLIVFALVGASLWSLFTRAGRPGWYGLVPVLNFWTAAEIGGRPGWWGLALVATLFVPVIGWLASLALGVMIGIGVAQAFGKDTGLGVVAGIIPFVGYPILALISERYLGPRMLAIQAPSNAGWANTPQAIAAGPPQSQWGQQPPPGYVLPAAWLPAARLRGAAGATAVGAAAPARLRPARVPAAWVPAARLRGAAGATAVGAAAPTGGLRCTRPRRAAPAAVGAAASGG